MTGQSHIGQCHIAHRRESHPTGRLERHHIQSQRGIDQVEIAPRSEELGQQRSSPGQSRSQEIRERTALGESARNVGPTSANLRLGLYRFEDGRG